MGKSESILAPLLVLMIIMGAMAFIFAGPEDLSEEEGKAITVTDALDREVKINAPVEKAYIAGKGGWMIVSIAYMFPSAKEKLYGLGEMITSARLFRKIDPDIDEKAVADTEMVSPQVEAIAARDPDVVIMKSYMKEDLGDPLEALDISVVYVKLEDPDSYHRDILTLGKIFGDEKRAENITSYYRETHDELSSRLGGSKEEDRPSALLLYYSTKGGTVSYRAPGAEWLQTTMIGTAGGAPLSEELKGPGWNIVSLEQIAEWDPDVVFLATYSDDPSPGEVKAELMNADIWKNLTAVREDRIFAVPHDSDNLHALGSWDSPNSRWILGEIWMASKLAPESLSDINITEVAKDFYVEMYGLSEEEAAEVVADIRGDL